ncbi:hypothetical protein B0H21DRAFT_840612 [Amylocystis lapponica]|nr:hypothetical protein B0H21DRAFT_840612 [Amylocystis lapponica]
MGFTSLRLPLYYTLWLFSGLLLSFTAVRLNYTTHLPAGDPLNNHVDFYAHTSARAPDPIVVELLVSSILALGFALFVFPVADRFLPDVFLEVRSSIAELIALATLWLFWLVGAAVSSTIWPNLSFCAGFAACRILSAMTAFAWLGWVTICGLLVVTLTEFLQRGREPDEPQQVEWAIPASFGAPASYASFDPPSTAAPSVRTVRTMRTSRMS